MKHFTINLAFTLVYASALIALLLDLLYWRPG